VQPVRHLAHVRRDVGDRLRRQRQRAGRAAVAIEEHQELRAGRVHEDDVAGGEDTGERPLAQRRLPSLVAGRAIEPPDHVVERGKVDAVLVHGDGSRDQRARVPRPFERSLARAEAVEELVAGAGVDAPVVRANRGDAARQVVLPRLAAVGELQRQYAAVVGAEVDAFAVDRRRQPHPAGRVAPGNLAVGGANRQELGVGDREDDSRGRAQRSCRLHAGHRPRRRPVGAAQRLDRLAGGDEDQPVGAGEWNGGELLLAPDLLAVGEIARGDVAGAQRQIDALLIDDRPRARRGRERHRPALPDRQARRGDPVGGGRLSRRDDGYQECRKLKCPTRYCGSRPPHTL